MAKRIGDGEVVEVPFLKPWRLGRRLSQEQLAERIGSTKASISRMETGKQNVTPPALKMLADALGTHKSILLSRAPTPEECPPAPPKPKRRSPVKNIGGRTGGRTNLPGRGR